MSSQRCHPDQGLKSAAILSLLQTPNVLSLALFRIVLLSSPSVISFMHWSAQGRNEFD
jgi:hypothetical protein